jgi:hypothetical protein
VPGCQPWCAPRGAQDECMNQVVTVISSMHNAGHWSILTMCTMLWTTQALSALMKNIFIGKTW